MTVTATSAATTTTPATSSSTASGASTDVVNAGRTSLAQNFDMFLTLLTAQMKNQDPLSPMDNNQFTQQLVAMTGVEQQLDTNDLLKQLVSNTGGNIASAVDLIGKNVEANSADTSLSSGKAQWTYHLDSDVPNMKIQVLNSSGQTVDVFAPSGDQATAGDHTLSWNGQNINGQTLPDGVYTLSLTTQGADGGDVAVGTIYQSGPATAVEQSNGQTLVTVNGTKVPLSDIVSITPIATSTTSTPATTSTGATSTSTTGQTSAAAA
jgi:flagellar basal-body rod modification protein FlgD